MRMRRMGLFGGRGFGVGSASVLVVASFAGVVTAAFPANAFAQAAAPGGTTSSGSVNATAPAAGGSVTTTTTTTTVTEPSATTTPAATEAHEEGSTVPRSEKEKEVESTISLFIDGVLGFGKSDTITQNRVAPNMAVYSFNRAQTTAESFLVGGGWEVCDHFELGARIPFSHGTIFPPDSSSRDTFALGNLEIEGAYKGVIAEHLELVAGLGVAVPTAQGDELPKNANGIDNDNFGQTNYDRGSVNRFAAASRGWEENALFETERVGLIPKVELKYRAGILELEPYVKFEALLGDQKGLDNEFIGEVVAGGRIGFHVVAPLSLGVRVWTNIPLHNDPGVETVGVAEPEVRLHLGPVEPYAGVILPFAGPLDNPYTVGARLGIIGRL